MNCISAFNLESVFSDITDWPLSILSTTELRWWPFHISRSCPHCAKLTTISVVARLVYYCVHLIFTASQIPKPCRDPVQRISTRSYVSQCQLIYSVITTAISLILGLFPAEIRLLMCFLPHKAS